MKIIKRNRKFVVGKKKNIVLKDKGSLFLENNENISIHFNKKINYDIAKKNWGFYCLPSINKRLLKFKLKALIAENKRTKSFFIMLILNNKKSLKEFKAYCLKEDLRIIAWLSKKNLNEIKNFFD